MVSEVYSRDIVFPRKFKVENITEDGSFAKIVVSPLQQGFGTTVGNILRRTLLSSIRGVAIDTLKITGAVHEYSTIDGVKENVCDIIYNLRRIIFASNLNNTKVSMSIKGPKKVYASDLELHADVKILNPEHYLFEITTDRQIDVELDLCAGIGDIFISQSKQHSIDSIQLDKHFSPVLNVKTAISQIRVDEKNDYDALTLEVKTNGSITAEESFKIAVSILTNFLTAIDDAQNKMYSNVLIQNEDKNNKDDVNYNLFRKVDDLELSVRSLNCLKTEGVEYIGDLVIKQENDMMKTPNFGRKSLNELKKILSDMNLSFGMNIQWRPSDLEKKVAEAQRYFNGE